MTQDDHDSLREELISAIHSDKKSKAFITSKLSDPNFVGQLVHVCFPYDYYSNDPRMEAAYFLSQCPCESVQGYVSQIEELLRLPADGETMNNNISFHLVKCLQRQVEATSYIPSADIAPLLVLDDSYTGE